MLIYLLKVNTVFTVLFLIYFFIIRKEKFLSVNRFTLMAIVALGFMLPLLPALDNSMLRFRHTGISAPAAFEFSVPGGAARPLSVSNVRPEDVQGLLRSRIFSLTSLYILYGIIVFICFVRLISRYLQVLYILKTSHKTKRDGSVYCNADIESPPFSFFNFIVIPEGIERQKLEHILVHENVHCAQLHSLDLLISELTVVVLWLNPAAYLLRNEVKLNLEFIADDAALARGIDPRSYQLNLLSFANIPLSSPAMPFSSKLGQRIKMMNSGRPARRNYMKFMAFLPVLLILSSITGFRAQNLPPTKDLKRQYKVPESINRSIILRPVTSKKHALPALTGLRKADTVAEKMVFSPAVLNRIAIKALTDTVRIRLTDEPIQTTLPFDGIYAIGDQTYTDPEIRKLLEPKHEISFILPARPSVTYFSPGDPQAVRKWGDKAAKGVISLQTSAY